MLRLREDWLFIEVIVLGPDSGVRDRKIRRALEIQIFQDGVLEWIQAAFKGLRDYPDAFQLHLGVEADHDESWVELFFLVDERTGENL